jgi:hypothetical protein
MASQRKAPATETAIAGVDGCKSGWVFFIEAGRDLTVGRCSDGAPEEVACRSGGA